MCDSDMDYSDDDDLDDPMDYYGKLIFQSKFILAVRIII